MAPFNSFGASSKDGSMEVLVARCWGDNERLWPKDKDIYVHDLTSRKESKICFVRKSVVNPHLASFALITHSG